MLPGFNKSAELFAEARRWLPGGVNSPVRAFKAVGRDPVFIARGDGAYLYDVDGNRYIDYVCSWGPLILGHRHPEVMAALAGCLERGTSFGAPTELEVELARTIVAAFPSCEMVRLVNSGTEATMSALRLARAWTGRAKIVKFAGCYHGHADYLLVKAGSGALTFGVPTSPGIPPDVAVNTLTAPYNDLETLERLFEQEGADIAAVIIEPVAGNMGVVPPRPGFLEGVRELTRSFGALLIFDEIITGFRVAYGGAQELYGIEADLTCFGKIIGGGLPVGAYGGKREIMEQVAPQGPVYQAGTLSGNPLAVTAGLATLKVLQRPGIYRELARKGARLAEGLLAAAREAGLKVTVNRVESLLCTFFTEKEVVDYETALSSDTARYAAFFKSMLNQGVYLAPSQFEALFISAAHTPGHLDYTIDAAARAFRELKKVI
ncbi:MAG: glutamate-1-semialdehyde 2,1-aminomutase [Bacillota bacterium]